MRIKTAPLHDVCQALSIDQRPPDGTEQCGVENEEPFVDLVLDNGQSASESTLCITVQVNEWVQEACTKASAHSQITIAVVITQTSSSTASTTDLFTHLQRTSGLNSLKAAKYAPQAEAMLVLICFGIHAVNDFATKLACHMI
ncbi:hypothetical protein H4R35_002914 [Dimargaris xerosporica]|nr:hypothetical protein H4R35_002914 [Dimargaris xerosporica]